jgi:hypothetical protein
MNSERLIADQERRFRLACEQIVQLDYKLEYLESRYKKAKRNKREALRRGYLIQLVVNEELRAERLRDGEEEYLIIFCPLQVHLNNFDVYRWCPVVIGGVRWWSVVKIPTLLYDVRHCSKLAKSSSM